MIKGFFSFTSTEYSEDCIRSNQFNFLYGHVSFSDYTFRLNSTSINFLFRSFESNFFREIFNKERQDEVFNFSSCRSLLDDPNFNRRFKEGANIYLIYDQCLNEFALVRDAFGTIPLFYSWSKAGIIFSTDLDDVISHPKFTKPIEINTSRVISYLTWMNNGLPHSNATFYRNVNNLLPGHFLLAKKEETILKPIVSFAPHKWNKLSTIEEYSEEFQYLFKKSVANCIKKRSNVSSHLSGGMDSSSVSSMIRFVAPDIDLYTLYAETNTKLTDESGYANNVAKNLRSNHIIVYPPTNELDILITNTSLYGFPEQMSISPSLQTELIKTASDLQSQIIMTGTDGDSVVGNGMNYLNTLYSEQSWDLLKTALSDLAKSRNGIGSNQNWNSLTPNQKEREVYRNFFYSRLVGLRTISETLNLLQIVNKKFDVRYKDFLFKGLTGLINKIKYFDSLPDSIISRQINFQEESSSPRFSSDSLLGLLSENYRYSFNDVFYIQAMALNEEKFYLGRNQNIEIGYPFYNSELFELNLAVPDKLKYYQGKGRGHFKQAMKGILIDEVRNRTDKGMFNEYARNAAIRLYYQSQDYLTDTNIIWEYVDKALFNKIVKLFLSENQPLPIYNKTGFFVTRVIYLSIWLNSKFN